MSADLGEGWVEGRAGGGGGEGFWLQLRVLRRCVRYTVYTMCLASVHVGWLCSNKSVRIHASLKPRAIKVSGHYKYDLFAPRSRSFQELNG